MCGSIPSVFCVGGTDLSTLIAVPKDGTIPTEKYIFEIDCPHTGTKNKKCYINLINADFYQLKEFLSANEISIVSWDVPQNILLPAKDGTGPPQWDTITFSREEFQAFFKAIAEYFAGKLLTILICCTLEQVRYLVWGIKNLCVRSTVHFPYCHVSKKTLSVLCFSHR